MQKQTIFVILLFGLYMMNFSMVKAESLPKKTLNTPNILFVFADDWGRYASIYSKFKTDKSLNSILSTPAIDRMAREGAIFTNAFVPSPSCTPCRSSVLSGRYFWQTRLGAILQSAVWDDKIPTFPRILENAGYHTGTTYKVWGPGVSAGVMPQGTPEHDFNAVGQKFNSFSEEVTKNIVAGKTLEDSKRLLYEEVRGNFIDFMKARKEAKPFLYWWGPTNTHRTWEKGSGLKLWGINPDKLKGLLPNFFPDVHEVREDVADYLGECMALDHGIAVLVKELEIRGELDNTLIVLSGDHGIPGFPRAKCNLYDIGCEVSLIARLPGTIPAGHIIEDYTNIMDLAPTFLEAAHCDPEPSMSGKSLWSRMTGKEQPKVNNWVITGRERHVATAREKNLPYPQRAIRTPEFLYIYNFEPDRWPMGSPNGMEDFKAPAMELKELEKNTRAVYPDMDASPTKAWMIHHRNEKLVSPLFSLAFDKRPQEELYEIRNDPHHMNNIANNPAFLGIKKQLHELLMGELAKHKDPRLCDTNVRYETSPYTDVLDHHGPKTQGQAIERLSKSGD